MNKKKYIKPETEMLFLETTQMIAASLPLVSGGGGGGEADESDPLADERDEIVEEGVWGNLWD